MNQELQTQGYGRLSSYLVQVEVGEITYEIELNVQLGVTETKVYWSHHPGFMERGLEGESLWILLDDYAQLLPEFYQILTDIRTYHQI